MQVALSVYFICTIVCAVWNHSFYKKIDVSNDEKRPYKLIAYFVLVFLGPISLAINIHFAVGGLYLLISHKIKRYRRAKRNEKMLEEMLKNALYEACVENGIEVQD